MKHFLFFLLAALVIINSTASDSLFNLGRTDSRVSWISWSQQPLDIKESILSSCQDSSEFTASFARYIRGHPSQTRTPTSSKQGRTLVIIYAAPGTITPASVAKVAWNPNNAPTLHNIVSTGSFSHSTTCPSTNTFNVVELNTDLKKALDYVGQKHIESQLHNYSPVSGSVHLVNLINLKDSSLETFDSALESITSSSPKDTVFVIVSTPVQSADTTVRNIFFRTTEKMADQEWKEEWSSRSYKVPRPRAAGIDPSDPFTPQYDTYFDAGFWSVIVGFLMPAIVMGYSIYGICAIKIPGFHELNKSQ